MAPRPDAHAVDGAHGPLDAVPWHVEAGRGHDTVSGSGSVSESGTGAWPGRGGDVGIGGHRVVVRVMVVAVVFDAVVVRHSGVGGMFMGWWVAGGLG